MRARQDVATLPSTSRPFCRKAPWVRFPLPQLKEWLFSNPPLRGMSVTSVVRPKSGDNSGPAHGASFGGVEQLGQGSLSVVRNEAGDVHQPASSERRCQFDEGYEGP